MRCCEVSAQADGGDLEGQEISSWKSKVNGESDRINVLMKRIAKRLRRAKPGDPEGHRTILGDA